MTEDPLTPPPLDEAAGGDPSIALKNVLNRHGYGFQYAALQRCLEQRFWHHAVSEYPVELNGRDIHIDFILGHGKNLIVAECKRTQGWTWGFARGHSATRARSAQQPRADFLTWNGGTLQRDPRSLYGWNKPPYDVALELKLRHENPKESATSKELNHALSQVLTGHGGLLDDLAQRQASEYGSGLVIPVIFTTAALIVTDTPLATADLQSGNISNIDTEPVEFVWYDYSITRSLRPTRVGRAPRHMETSIANEQLRQTSDRDLVKSVAIVTATGIPEFLGYLSDVLASGGFDPV